MIRFHKIEKVIILDISGRLPILGEFPDTFEVIDDEETPKSDISEANPAQIIQSVEKHADYDFTLHEYSKNENQCRNRRKMRFTFNEDQSEIKLEYTAADLISGELPMYFYFKSRTEELN